MITDFSHQIIAQAQRLGAIAVGFAKAEPVDTSVRQAYEQWIAGRRHGTMDYLDRYPDVRFDPRELLPGAQTVISLAFPYRPAGGYHHPCIADYALGQDYHVVLRQKLSALGDFIGEATSAQSRPCIDTAPILERYWAVKAGVGFIGRNHQLIVPGIGSGVFLAELVTTLPLEPSDPSTSACEDCGRCIAACPGNALGDDGTFDARLCKSYLSIEYRGELALGQLGTCVYGCDICQQVCPHNAGEPPLPLAEFQPDTRLLDLDRAALSALSAGDWRRLSRLSAMRRITYRQLRRNLSCNDSLTII